MSGLTPLWNNVDKLCYEDNRATPLKNLQLR